MEEKKINKYQEAIEDVETGTVPRSEGLPPREKIEQVPKPELPEQIKPKEEAPIEAIKPKSSTDDSPSKTLTEKDEALRAKKIEEIKKLSQEGQIKALCNLAFEKDIDFAAETAKGLNDAYVLDEFHDKLDKLNLIKKGKLKEI